MAGFGRARIEYAKAETNGLRDGFCLDAVGCFSPHRGCHNLFDCSAQFCFTKITMKIDEFKKILSEQLNWLLSFCPDKNHTRFLMNPKNPQRWDSTSLLSNAQAFASELILCPDESAARELMQRDQEKTRAFYLWAIDRWGKINEQSSLLRSDTLASNSLPFYALAAWAVDMANDDSSGDDAGPVLRE